MSTMPDPDEKRKSTDDDFQRLREHPLWNLVVGIVIFSIAVYLLSLTVGAMSGSAETALKISEIVRNYLFLAGGFVTGIAGLYLAWRRVTAANRQAEASFEQAQAALRQSIAATQQADVAAENAIAVAKHTATQLELLKQTQANDVFAKSVEQLGSQVLATKLGGIYSLERIAKESKDLHPQVMEILASYVRAESPWPLPQGTLIEAESKIDVQSALDVISRRNTQHDDSWRKIDLQNCDLSPYQMSNRNWIRIDFSYSNLTGLLIMHSEIHSCHFFGTTLVRASLNFDDFKDCLFYRADCSGVEFEFSTFEDIKFEGETDVSGADFSKSKNMTPAMLEDCLNKDKAIF